MHRRMAMMHCSCMVWPHSKSKLDFNALRQLVSVFSKCWSVPNVLALLIWQWEYRNRRPFFFLFFLFFFFFFISFILLHLHTRLHIFSISCPAVLDDLTEIFQILLQHYADFSRLQSAARFWRRESLRSLKYSDQQRPWPSSFCNCALPMAKGAGTKKNWSRNITQASSTRNTH